MLILIILALSIFLCYNIYILDTNKKYNLFELFKEMVYRTLDHIKGINV